MSNKENNSTPVVIIKIILSIIVGAIFYIEIKDVFLSNSLTVGFGIAFLIFVTIELTEFILRTIQEANDIPKEFKVFGNKFMTVFNYIYHIITIILGLVVIYTGVTVIDMQELIFVGFIILIKGIISLIAHTVRSIKKAS